MKRRAFVKSSLAAALSAPAFSPESLFRPIGQDPADVDAITGDGKEITLKGKAIKELGDRLNGPVLLAHDEGYDQARMILNPSFDKHPALIAQPTGTADVRLAVDFAREHSLLTAVKCGGHSFSGKSTCDKGIQIDLSRFRNVRIDPKGRKAWVTGGSLLGPLDHEAMAHGLVTPMGTVSHTGVGGLVTGGGFGRVARRFGLAIDNLTAVNVVTADGEFRYADANENPDLYWGVRGGSGNFGIVTSFEFQLHPMQRQVLGGTIGYPIARAKEFLDIYADYAPQSRDDLTLDLGMVIPPGGAPGFVGASVCYSGPPSEADRALAPIRSMGTPMIDDVQPMDYVALQRSGDTDDFRARAAYLKSGFIGSMTSDLTTAMAESIEGHPDRATIVAIQQSGGKIGRVANDATAFSHRDATGNLLAIVDWAYGEDGSEHIAYDRRYWADLERFTLGFYTNDMPEDAGAAAIGRNFGSNYQRLVKLKNKYDPTNLFRLNANIEPTV
jgi:FAD/FMN-containing dehydrogenase